jgi:hypothetical protein
LTSINWANFFEKLTEGAARVGSQIVVGEAKGIGDIVSGWFK